MKDCKLVSTPLEANENFVRQSEPELDENKLKNARKALSRTNSV